MSDAEELAFDHVSDNSLESYYDYRSVHHFHSTTKNFSFSPLEMLWSRWKHLDATTVLLFSRAFKSWRFCMKHLLTGIVFNITLVIKLSSAKENGWMFINW
jgi:hypothetical protein